MAARRIVIIGAGIAGCSLADELTARGEHGVTVVDRGPLFATGGATTHAPGLVSRTSASRLLHRLADVTVRKLRGLELDGAPCFLPVGTVEVATDEARLFELRRRLAFATSWGLEARLIGPDECAALHPLLDPAAIVGGFATEGEGIGKALRGAEAQARSAQARGARFVGETRVTGIRVRRGAVSGVDTDHGPIDADLVVLAAGPWGRRIAATVGLVLPMAAMEHLYAVTAPVPALAPGRDTDASLPIVRHWDGGVYVRDEGDRAGIGSFNHAALPIDLDEDGRPRLAPAMLAFTPEHFAASWRATVDVMPALRDVSVERAFNGVFAYTPDGLPLIGEAPEVAGLWALECLWVTHAVGAAQSLAEVLVGLAPTVDLTAADLTRFDEAELGAADVAQRCANAYVDTYAVHHPAEPSASPRGVRYSPFAGRQEALGAAFFDTAGWERPRWYEANAARVDAAALPRRDGWSGRHWSPVCAAEHRATRERAGIFDMTSLRRITVAGRGAAALLDDVVSRPCGPVGSAAYGLLLDSHGRIASDVTVARLADDRFLVGGNSPRDALWLRAHANGRDVRVEDVTAGTCCLAVWGPAARALLGPLADGALDDASFPYLAVRELEIAGVPVTALRVSYVGELGWELSTSADRGLRLWDAVSAAGRGVDAVVAGRGALTSLRLEKGYRAWGQDMSREDLPAEAGLGFAVHLDDRAFVGRRAVEDAPPPRRRLRTLALDPIGVVPTGGEPVAVGDGRSGYVTSAEQGFTVGFPVALAWLPADVPIGASVVVRSPVADVPAVVAADALYDARGERLRG